MFKRLSLMAKIISVSTLTMIALGVVLFISYSISARKKAEESYIEKSRAICLTAESAREEMEAKWDHGLFSVEQLNGYAAKNEIDKILAAVPVVTAWNAAMRKADEGDYRFKVPKINPRNPKNEPDQLELQALKAMKTAIWMNLS